MEPLEAGSVTRRIVADSLFVALCLTAVKAAGAVKVVMIARGFGATDALDAYLVAFLLPSYIAETIAGPLSIALVPALIGAREQSGRAAMHRLVENISTVALTVLGAGAVVLAAAAPVVLELLGSGASDEKRALTLNLMRAMIPMIPLGGLSIVWRAALNAEQRFAAPALGAGFAPLMIILLLARAGSSANAWTLAAGTIIGLLLELLCLAAVMHFHGLPLLPRWHGREPATRAVGMQHWPLIVVAAISHGNVLVDQAMAATLGSGSISALKYGTSLNTVLAGIGSGALSVTALPHFSRMISTGDWTGFRRTLRTYSGLALLSAIPMALFLIAVSPFLVKLFFQRGAFTEAAAAAVTLVQRIALLALPIAILNSMLLRVISSLRANALLVRMSVGALAVNTAGDYVLMQWLGLPGIPLASGLVQLLSLGYISFVVWKQVRAQSLC